MKTASKLILTLAAASILSACTQPSGQPNSGVLQGGGVNKQDIGTVIGGVTGGVLGHQIGGGKGKTVATIAGTLLGAALGNSLGQSLDKADVVYYNQTSQTALDQGQTGKSFPWSNPETGNSGSVTPGNYYKTETGQYCREYSQTINVGGKSQRAYGTACRQPDGEWKVVQ